MPTKHVTVNSPLTDFNDSNTIFVIEDPINLKPIQEQESLTITLGVHSVLTFTDDGAILNGTIEGNLSSIDFMGQENRLSNVTLTGTWVGSICDLIFAYDTTPAVKPVFNNILKGLLRFQKIDLLRSEYFLQWEAVNPNATDEPKRISRDMEINGHGAQMYLSSSKGSSTNGTPRRRISPAASSRTSTSTNPTAPARPLSRPARSCRRTCHPQKDGPALSRTVFFLILQAIYNYQIMTTVIIDTTPSSLSVFSAPDTIFEICIGINLNKATVYMGRNTVLRFMGGSFDDGYIRGYHTSVESLDNHAVFDRVELSGEWYGAIHDLLFSYDANSKADFTPILTSLFCFERIDLYREKYYLTWTRIGIDTPQDIELDGHGAIWYISGNKGTPKPWNNTDNKWGPSYEVGVLISYYYYVRGVFRVRNLVIEDNSETSGIQGFGEVIDYSNTIKYISYHDVQTELGDPKCKAFRNHIVYTIFEGLASGLTEFDNVRYDGGGKFFGAYNQWVDAERLVFKNCDFHTGGFAVEVLNLGNPGSIKDVLFDNCILHNHLSRFVGVLSFVDAGMTERLRIINSKICGYRGNLEVSGVKDVWIDNTIFVNQALCSQRISGPCSYKCTDSQFFLTDPTIDHSWFSFAVMGENVIIENCSLYLTQYIEFSHLDRLYLFNNVFIIPSSNTDYVLTTDQKKTLKIGYYGNNQVSSPRIYQNQINLRLDTSYAMAEYEPFRVAFRNDFDNNPCHDTFNWSKDLWTIYELNAYLSNYNQPPVTVNPDGYATGYGISPGIITKSIVNETVSITMIGQSSTGNSEDVLAYCSVGDVILYIKDSYDFVFIVSLGSSQIARIPRSEEDIRLDVTVTRINWDFEVFVFVNKELQVKARMPGTGYVVPAALFFTPNTVTIIRAIRFVPGGFILDEPQDMKRL